MEMLRLPYSVKLQPDTKDCKNDIPLNIECAHEAMPELREHTDEQIEWLRSFCEILGDPELDHNVPAGFWQGEMETVVVDVLGAAQEILK